MERAYYIKEDKSNVQDYYVHVILESLKLFGYETIVVEKKTMEMKGIPKSSCLVLISHYNVLRYYRKGFRNIIYWVQGSSPDESFMRNHSYVRKFIISCIEYFALEKSKLVFMVSQGMLKHYKRKYHKDYSYKTYIMPCYNDRIEVANFKTLGKYTNNVFCYVGGLSVWQCFPETVAFYKSIEDDIPNAEFRVFTPDVDKAKQIMEDAGLKRYSAKFVKSDELSKELAECKFGFILRAKSPVNYVATPTKLSNYLASGLIPIVSDSVEYFKEVLDDCKYAVVLSDNSDNKKVLDLAQKAISTTELLAEYSKIFDTYYNDKLHIENISKIMRSLDF